MVPRTGLEPANPFGRQPLKLVRLPISPPGQRLDKFGLRQASEVDALSSHKYACAGNTVNLQSYFDGPRNAASKLSQLGLAVGQLELFGQIGDHRFSAEFLPRDLLDG